MARTSIAGLSKSIRQAGFMPALLLVFFSCATVSGAQQEQYTMDGLPVSKAFYDSGQLVAQGINLLRSNRNDEACAVLAQAVATAPEYAEAHQNYGLALAKTGKTAVALEELKKAVAIKPTLEPSWISLGGLYQATGHLPEAIACYNEFLIRFPQSNDATAIRGLLVGLQQVAASQSNIPHNVQSESSNSLLDKKLAAATRAAEDNYLAAVTTADLNRWPASRMPLKVYTRPGTGVPGFRPQFDMILRKSFDDWAVVSPRIRFRFVENPEDADILCSWINDSNKLANNAELGETHLSLSGHDIVKGDIEFLTVPPVSGGVMSDNTLRSTALHEIGHILGYTGHTTNPDDIMFYDSGIIVDRWRTLSQRDANTINDLYSVK